MKDGVKYWFCRLAPNRKALHYGDSKEEKDEVIPSIDNLQTKLELSQLTPGSLVTGDKCPHFNKGYVDVRLLDDLIQHETF
jgi:engulfment/cell motility protein 1/engulfment and cell motility protein 2